MASEEPKTNIGSNPVPPPPAPAPAQVPVTAPALPPYPELILAAIDGLNDESGSNKSTISRQIESTYGNLPLAHSTLLTHHLNRMKSIGQLILLKNNYFKPNPNAPPRRGRGRPPKSKPALPAGHIPPPPRPRGRPPKSKDPHAPSPPPKRKSPTSTGTGRKRGRPPKMPKTGFTETPAAASGVPGGAPKGRGRPPKVKPAVSAASAATVGA